MNFNLNTEQQDAILYAVTFALSNQVVTSQETLNNLYDVLDMFKAEELKPSEVSFLLNCCVIFFRNFSVTSRSTV